METATLQTSSSLFLPPDSYIYKLQCANTGALIAAISSDDSLRVFDLGTLAKQSTAVVGPDNALKDVHTGVTCLEAFGAQQEHCVLTAGRDGAVRGWDLRSGKRILELKDQNGAQYLSLGVSGSNHLLAAGTELTHAQATVEIWDYRSTKDSLRKYVESHNDDVSEVNIPPTALNSLVIRGHEGNGKSTDGLVNIYNTAIPNEDDALVQITNHGSSVHHAGFLTDTQLYALSHDEIFSVYPLTSQNDEAAAEEDNAPTKFGDLRGLLNCEYIVDIMNPAGNGNAIIGAGIHSDRSSLALIPLHQSGSKWCINPDRAIQLDGAHGSEIVRSICFPNH
ncbi:hypothetical protein MMC31_006120, partial [Peltigera leucophlebia]|nr:hypothetical protein [Peltigera leucophlebia]